MTKEFNLWGIKHDPGEKYQPCNGTEGVSFMGHFCDKCKEDAENNCDIVASAMIFMPNNPEYPTEWVYNENGNPTCTAFDDVESTIKTEHGPDCHCVQCVNLRIHVNRSQ